MVATVQSGRSKMTYRDYAALPDDGKRYEMIDGELHVSPSPLLRHQEISKKIMLCLVHALEDSQRGKVFYSPIDVVLDDENIVQPDLVFISADRTHILKDKNIQGAPDLVIEILSPHTRRMDTQVKFALYARFNVPHYWIVDPDSERVETYRLQDGSYRSAGACSSPETMAPEDFPGLTLDLKAVFKS